MPFSSSKPKHAVDAGRRGGRSRSKAKRAAVRRNGRLGGRPRKPEVKGPLLTAIEQATAPREHIPIDPLAARPPLDVLRRRPQPYVLVVGSYRDSEREWDGYGPPPAPTCVRRKVFFRLLGGFTQLLGEAKLTGVVPSIEEIDNHLCGEVGAHLCSPGIDGNGKSRNTAAFKRARDRERAQIYRAVYWSIRYEVEGKTVEPRQRRIPRPPHPGDPAFARYVLEHGLPDEFDV